MNKVTKFAIVSRDDSESIKISKDIQRYLFNNGMAYADKDPDIVCVVGGDGTFLTAIHKYINKLDQVVFAAVNTGTLGFFADYTVEELDQYVSDIVNKQPNIEKKKLLKITVNGKERKTYLAVNEMRIENVIKTQTIDVYINEKKLAIIASLISAVGIGLGAFLTIVYAPTLNKDAASSIGMDVIIAIVFGGMPVSGGPRSRILSAVVGAFSMGFRIVSRYQIAALLTILEDLGLPRNS